jgi:lysozyme
MTSTGNALGMDVSHYQGSVDWEEVRNAGLSFAFAKATEGIDWADPYFTANWEGIKQAGLLRGAYHFFEPDDDAGKQAEWFLATVHLEPGDLPPVLDVEKTAKAGNAALWSGVEAWLAQVQSKSGFRPMLYLSPSFWNDHDPPSSLTAYPLWAAEYSSQLTLPKGWACWHFWQYSQSGTVAGKGPYDVDRFNGTAEQLAAYAAGHFDPCAVRA